MYRLLRLFSKVRAHSRRCSSFPTATRRASVSDIAATRWSLTDVACPLRVLCWARSWRAALRAAFTLGLYLFRQRMAKRKTRREVCLSFWVLAAEGVLHSFDFQCSGEMNSPCAEVLPAAKRSYGANAPPRRAEPQPMPASLSSTHGTPEQAICACSGFFKKRCIRISCRCSLPRCSWLLLPGVLRRTAGRHLTGREKPAIIQKLSGCSAVGSAHGSGP